MDQPQLTDELESGDDTGARYHTRWSLLPLPTCDTPPEYTGPSGTPETRSGHRDTAQRHAHHYLPANLWENTYKRLDVGTRNPKTRHLSEELRTSVTSNKSLNIAQLDTKCQRYKQTTNARKDLQVHPPLKDPTSY